MALALRRKIWLMARANEARNGRERLRDTPRTKSLVRKNARDNITDPVVAEEDRPGGVCAEGRPKPRGIM